MMPVDLVIVPKNMKNGIGQRYVQLLHQTEKYRTVTSKQCNGDKFKKCLYTATLVWSIFAKIDKSNIAVIAKHCCNWGSNCTYSVDLCHFSCFLAQVPWSRIKHVLACLCFTCIAGNEHFVANYVILGGLPD